MIYEEKDKVESHDYSKKQITKAFVAALAEILILTTQVYAKPDIKTVSSIYSDDSYSYPEKEDLIGKLQWPLDNPTVTQKFGVNKGRPYKDGHLGLDITAYFGAPVKSAADGSIEAKGSEECPNFDKPDCNYRFGNWVMVWHPELKVHTIYSHLKEPSNREINSYVKQGEVIGHEGGSGFQFDVSTDSTNPIIGDPNRHHLDFMVGIFKPYKTYENKTDFQVIIIYDPLLLLQPLKDSIKISE